MRTNNLPHAKVFSARAFFICCISLLLQLHASAQNDSVQLHYLQKSKNQKTGAWVMLAGGVGLVIIGAAVSTSAMISDAAGSGSGSNASFEAGGVVAFIGVLSVAGSIPLFIVSGKNKRRAALSASTSYSSRLQMNGIARIPQPCLKLAIPLR